MIAQDKPELTVSELWRQCEESFVRITKRELRASSSRRLEDVIRILDNRYTIKNQVEAEQKAKTKRAVQNVLYCIQLLGGIAAQAGGIVFGPANLCFNAVSFLCEIPGKIDAVYNGIANLMDGVYTQLTVFKIYRRIEQQSSIDQELLENTHRIMIAVCNICALSYKLIEGGKLSHLKTSLKVVFLNDDSGVKDEYENLEKLTRAQATVTGAITLEHVLSTEKELAQVLINQCESAEKLNKIGEGVDILVSASKEERMEKQTKDQLEKISKRLNIDSAIMTSQEKMLTKMKNEAIKDTGLWLQEVQNYTSWSDPENEVDPLLLMYGGKTSGKSYLVPTIIEDLDPTFLDSATRRPKIMIGYYFFSRQDYKGGREKQDDKPVEMALKCMCLQIASQYKPYAKEMATMCDQKRDSDFKDLSYQELWSLLKLGTPRGEALHYFIFDGLDLLAQETANALAQLLALQRPKSLGYMSAKPERSRIRILATGSEKIPSSSLPELISTPLLRVADFNHADISRYIEQELQADEVLKADHLEMKNLKNAIRDRLPGLADGDYTIVQQKLQRIRTAIENDEDVDNIESIIDESPNEDAAKIANSTLDELNTSLSAQDIKQLNELLIWTLHGERVFTINELRTALYLRSKKSSIQAFDKKLKSKYSKVFEFIDEGVELDFSIKDLLDVKNQRISELASEDSSAPKISLTLSITNASMKKVQQFLWDLAECAAFEKFPFDAKNAEVEAKGKIYVNKIDAFFTMTHQLLEILVDEPDEKTEPLVNYALHHLGSHLDRLRNTAYDSPLTPIERKVILERLLSLLIDTDTVEKHWMTGSELHKDWLNVRYAVMAIDEWLEDKEAANLLEPRDKRALRRLLDESQGFGGFWKKLTLAVAKGWLLSRKWPVLDALEWVDGFINMNERNVFRGKYDYTPSLTPSPPLFPMSPPPGAVIEDKDTSINGDVPPSPLEESHKEDAIDDDASVGSLQEKGPDAHSPRSSTPSSPRPSRRPREDMVKTTAEWVKETLAISECNSLWWDRVGLTYYCRDEYKSAVEAYKKAIALPDVHMKAHEGLAKTYAGLKKYYLASREMEVVFAELRSKGNEVLDVDEKKQYVTRYKQYAGWKTKSDRPHEAFHAYEEALKLDPEDYDICCEMIVVLRTAKDFGMAKEFFMTLKNQQSLKDDTNRLVDMMCFMAKENDWPHDAFIPLTQLVRQNELNSLMLDIMNTTFNIFNTRDDKESTIFARGCLLLYEGCLKARQYDGHEAMKPALDCWEQSRSIFIGTEWDDSRGRFYADHYLSSFHCQQAIEAYNRAEYESYDYHIDRLEVLSAKTAEKLSYPLFENACLLGACLRTCGKSDKTKILFKDHMKDAIYMLSDNDPNNDADGYVYLADVFLHYGDDLNALSAWSLIGPKSSEPIDPLSSPVLSPTEEIDPDLEAEEASLERIATGKSGETDAKQSAGEEPENRVEEGVHSMIDSAVPIVNAPMANQPVSRLPLEITTAVNGTGAGASVPGPRQSAAFETTDDSKAGVEVNESIDHNDDKAEMTTPPVSLKIPPKERKGELDIPCSGHCGKSWTYGDDFYICKFCHDTICCAKCRQEIMDRKLDRYWCDSSHTWLYIPPWNDDDAAEVGKGRVRIEGELVDGKRIGGRTVEIREWLNMIRKDWGLEVSASHIGSDVDARSVSDKDI